MTPSPRALRLLFIVLVCLSLPLGIWIGVAQFKFIAPVPSSAILSLHGPLMIFGFLFTWLGLERVSAINRWWIYGVSLLSVLSALSLLLQLPAAVAPFFAANAALLLAWCFIDMYQHHHENHFIIMVLSAAVLFSGNLLWLTALPIHRIVPWWAGFVILLLGGERHEMARARDATPWVQDLFRAAAIVFVTGLALSPFEFRLSLRIAGAAMIAMALWLLRYDGAWQSFKTSGLPRFMALCHVAGYLWLGVGGVAWLWFARFFGAGPLYDAMLQTVFVGFVMSMLFAQTPVVLSKLLQLPPPFEKIFYLHAALLHIALLARVIGDLGFLPEGQKWGGLLNAAALALFMFNSFLAVGAARRNWRGNRWSDTMTER